MTEYCTATDVKNRLTVNGYLNLGDRDGDGYVDAGELASYITAAIEWAGTEIDYALINHQPPYVLATARAAANVFLRSRCVDLAAWQIATNGGRDVPDSFQAAYDRAVEMLDAIRDKGTEVPGLVNGTTTFNENSHEVFEYHSEWVT